MSTRWTTTRTHMGTQVQSAVPSGSVLAPQGLFLRGVVIAVYPYDTDGTSIFPNQSTQSNDYYVDVLIYGRHQTVLSKVIWTTARSGLHEGDIAPPRAADLDVSGSSLDITKSQPQALSGDHVIVGFLENDFTQPFVVAALNHPNSDAGNSDRPLGQRLRIRASDGTPRLWKHRGSAFGIDTAGNFTLDTRRAHSGAYQANGQEPAPTNNGANGNTVIDLQQGSTVTIRINDENAMTIANEGARATVTIGDGAVPVAVAPHLQTLYTNLKAQFDALAAAFDSHIHTTTATIGAGAAPGVLTPPTAPSGAIAPDWDANINSDKLTIPNTG